jgi:hypothetical protein
LRGERKYIEDDRISTSIFHCAVPLGFPTQTKDVVVVRVSERFLQSKRKTIASHSQTTGTSFPAQKISKIKVKRSRKRFLLTQFVLFAIGGRAAKSLTNRCDTSKSDSISSQPVKSQSIFRSLPSPSALDLVLPGTLKIVKT